MFVFALVACGWSDVAPATGVPFPHPDDYKVGTNHGDDSLTYGTAACNGCHQPGATAPTCDTCHADTYPHPDGWLDGSVHGAHLTGEAGEARRAPCLECHGQEGFAAPACTSCHASWPHPAGWEEAGQHGVYAIARGDTVAVCGACHGAELEGDGDAPSCTKCHTTYPHASDWGDGDKHGAITDRTECWLCHGDGGTSGGTAGVSCQTCHSSYPHPADWATTHMATATRQGEAGCLVCHAAGDGSSSGTFTMPASCGTTCHGSAK